MIDTVEATRIRSAVYAAFLQGFGGPSPTEDWGVALGRPTRYTKHGTAYRQQFERGITLANVGDRSAVVELDGLYRDLDGTLRTEVSLHPYAGDLLVPVSPEPGRIPRQDGPGGSGIDRHDP